MARKSDGAGRFVAEFELSVTPHEAAVIRKRMEAGRAVYNALLGEGLKRLDQYRQSRLYTQARRIPKRTNEQRAARNDAFKAAREAWNWSEVGLTGHLQRYGQQFTRAWLNHHVNSQIVKKLAERVAGMVMRHSLGKIGRPRFKRFETLASLEAINNLQGIILKTDARGGLFVDWGAGKGAPHVHLPLRIDPQDTYQHYALAAMRPEDGFPGLKYTRVCRRIIRGRERFFAQVVLIGKPLVRQPLQRIGVVGLDIGPSTIAIVSEAATSFRRFCPDLEPKEKSLRILRRRIDRQRRANNPDCFDDRGRWIRGKRARVVSARMAKSLSRLRTVQNQQAAHRKSLHGHLVRQLLAVGSDFRMEKLSYRSFQGAFGRSSLARAPGMFVSHLRRKATEAGATVTEFSTYRTRLSQTCHGCGAIQKKPLSQRTHDCPCGVRGHRDLYSAYLARFVDGDRVDLNQARCEWIQFQPQLHA